MALPHGPLCGATRVRTPSPSRTPDWRRPRPGTTGCTRSTRRGGARRRMSTTPRPTRPSPPHPPTFRPSPAAHRRSICRGELPHLTAGPGSLATGSNLRRAATAHGRRWWPTRCLPRSVTPTPGWLRPRPATTGCLRSMRWGRARSQGWPTPPRTLRFRTHPRTSSPRRPSPRGSIWSGRRRRMTVGHPFPATGSRSRKTARSGPTWYGPRQSPPRPMATRAWCRGARGTTASLRSTSRGRACPRTSRPRPRTTPGIARGV